MNRLTRREALVALSLTSTAMLCGTTRAYGRAKPPRSSLGIVNYAFGIHQRYNWKNRYPGLSPARCLLEESNALGAAGIQVDLSSKDAPQIVELRRRAEQYGMYIEASIMPPHSAEDSARFEKEIRLAKEAGASLARTVLFPGRRYEQFKSLEEFREYEKRAEQSLRWAQPVLARERFRLAVENHKDQRIEEKLALLKKFDLELIGLCVDVGNSFTLIEDPLATVQAFAPFAFTVHFKDQSVRESEHGFWYADEPLGRGILDLPKMFKVLRDAKPEIHFNLEVITRDPLNVPMFQPCFWITLPDVKAQELGQTLATLRSRSAKEPFEIVSKLSPNRQMARERKNVERSLAYAREKLHVA